jgi:hypothetical protein
MSSRRYLHAFVLVALIMLAPRHARAISLTLAGTEPAGVPSTTDLTSTLWASLPGGALVRVAAIGTDAPGGGKFTELGVPSISPESQVIFGAEVTGTDGVARWEIFRGDLTAPPSRRLVRAIESAAASPGCVPNIRLDPYPIAGSKGAIAFIAPEAKGSDALFRYADRELTCAVRIGDRTVEGHRLRMMHFGSATMAPAGDVAFLGRIDNGDGRAPGADRRSRLAMILAPPHGPIRELAVEGSYGPNGSRYLAGFGLPAAVSTQRGPIVAFTAFDFRGSDSRGYALYVFGDRKPVEVMASGDRTSVGPVTFLSDGRPALSARGDIAVRGASADRRAIFSVRDGHPMVVVTPGHVTEVGSRIVTFGDPVVSASGRIMFGIIDNDDRNLLYAVKPGNLLRVSVPPVPDGELVEGLAPQIFAGTLVINESGAFAFIGGKAVKQ